MSRSVFPSRSVRRSNDAIHCLRVWRNGIARGAAVEVDRLNSGHGFTAHRRTYGEGCVVLGAESEIVHNSRPYRWNVERVGGWQIVRNTGYRVLLVRDPIANVS